MVGQDAPPR